ncbi:TonB-dependent receptor [Sphingopyxis sp.]|uniref:TonB-dependent receptor n=1 Tax=Sphingopyxis sp. TaxID=1908224 RepID=UPI0010F69876|nr:TonB-dependent receptor [Sphingopyxis sp.]MBR2171039.1 TonB-dependent receptor [Sphingopyxis sp.]
MSIEGLRLSRIALAASAATWLAVTPAAAQQSTEDQTVGVADIVVTAQKREENLQDTPISMVALSAETLEEKGIGSLSDLFTGTVPSIRIAPFVGRVSAVSIGMRGLVPVDATQVSRDPTVGIYIDSVYLGRVSGLGMELADIERIEVLRGPQGTLFGRNTIGGAISVVSKKPTGEASADLKAGIGNYRGRSFAAHVNLPEAAGLSVKVDGVFEGRGGLVDNPLPGALDYSEIKRYGFKISALWRLADNVSLLYAYDLSRDKSTGYYHYITASTQSPAVTPSFIKLDTGRVRTGRFGFPVFRNPQEAKGHSLTAEWDVSDALTIRSISAWRNLDSTQLDTDEGSNTTWGPNRRFARLSYANVKQHQFSQEVQLVGDVGELKFVVGAYYFEEEGQDEAIVYSLGTLNSTLTGVNFFPAPSPDGGATRLPDRAAQVDVKSKALFGQATWSPEALRGLHITAGARYTDDHKDGRLLFIAGVNPNLDFVFDSSRVDPMATIAYDFSEDINAYVKWSRAYRAGGANTRSVILRTFGEEELTAWEAGVKADLFDRRLRVNVAAYISRLSNQQVDFLNPVFISNTETVNAPEKRKIKGIEADITLVPVRGLSLSANYVYTDAPPTPVRNIFTGVIEQASSAFTPTHAASFSADYVFPAFSFGELRAYVGLDTAGNYIPNGTVTVKADKALLLNGRLTLGDIDLGRLGELEVALWGKNLTNTTYNLFDFRIPGRTTATLYNEPRTYGLEARVKF